MTSSKFTPEQVAKFFGASLDNVKKQYASNANDLLNLSKKSSGKKINGFSKDQLLQMSQSSFLKSI